MRCKLGALSTHAHALAHGLRLLGREATRRHAARDPLGVRRARPSHYWETFSKSAIRKSVGAIGTSVTLKKVGCDQAESAGPTVRIAAA